MAVLVGVGVLQLIRRPCPRRWLAWQSAASKRAPSSLGSTPGKTRDEIRGSSDVITSLGSRWA
eukprot:5284644-Pleurochrysis_carterae.AAC.1